MRYVIRADASQAIGSGHVMRSSAIAEELIARGEDVVFVGEFSDVPWLVDRINGLGFSQIFSNSESFISDPNTDVLILDSYIVPIDDDFIQQGKWGGIVVIADDVTPPYKTDLIIHPGLSADWIQVSNVKVLAGPRYIPFRKSIKKNHKSSEKLRILEILVVGGGTDSFNFVEAICGALKKIEGNFHAFLFTNSGKLAQLDSRFTVVPIGSALDEYSDAAELVFTTASTTSLEFIAREIAVGIGCAIDNQEEYYETLSCAEVASPIGRLIKNNWEIEESKVALLVQSQELRDALRQKCVGLMDLKGAKRIVDEILTL
jgi:spore coat polysaccharide biosynthesis predicted glycosyltransferase SpsG